MLDGFPSFQLRWQAGEYRIHSAKFLRSVGNNGGDIQGCTTFEWSAHSQVLYKPFSDWLIMYISRVRPHIGTLLYLVVGVYRGSCVPVRIRGYRVLPAMV